jgi:hypothetical protein
MGRPARPPLVKRRQHAAVNQSEPGTNEAAASDASPAQAHACLLISGALCACAWGVTGPVLPMAITGAVAAACFRYHHMRREMTRRLRTKDAAFAESAIRLATCVGLAANVSDAAFCGLCAAAVGSVGIARLVLHPTVVAAHPRLVLGVDALCAGLVFAAVHRLVAVPLRREFGLTVPTAALLARTLLPLAFAVTAQRWGTRYPDRDHGAETPLCRQMARLVALVVAGATVSDGMYAVAKTPRAQDAVASALVSFAGEIVGTRCGSAVGLVWLAHTAAQTLRMDTVGIAAATAHDLPVALEELTGGALVGAINAKQELAGRYMGGPLPVYLDAMEWVVSAGVVPSVAREMGEHLGVRTVAWAGVSAGIATNVYGLVASC